MNIQIMKLLIFVILFFCQCNITKNSRQEGEDILQYCQFVEIVSPFEIKILDYTSGGDCGTRAFASSCIGVTQKYDTIRVLSLCNTDTSFKVNQMVIVTPESKPIFEVTIAHSWVKKKNKIYISDIQKTKRKTIYGKMGRIAK